MVASSNSMPNDSNPIPFKNDEHQALLEKLWVSRSEPLTEQKDVKDRKRRKNRADLDTDRHFEAGKTPSNSPSREKSSGENANKLQLGGKIGHAPPVMPDDIDDLRDFLRNDASVQKLSDDDKGRLKKINIDFVAAAQDGNVVTLLLKVPKSTIESGARTVFIPLDALPNDEAKQKRRELIRNEAEELRQNLTPEQLAERRRKDALRKQEKRNEARLIK